MRKKDFMGFTLIELLVVMAIIALLLTIAVPRYIKSTTRAQETVLKQDLTIMREAIDKYYGDTGRYPAVLDDLVMQKYLRQIPIDPLTQTRNWTITPPSSADSGGVYDIHSTASGQSLDGSNYKDW